MYKINIELIDPNPWQPRQGFDDAETAELAADILSRRDSRAMTSGLLQLPMARIVDKDGVRISDDSDGKHTDDISIWLRSREARVQLAFGHRRFRAFCRLAKEDSEYATVPVEIVEFGDEEMAAAAWTENSARKNLSAIEEARAIRAMMRSFKWKQAEAAEKLNMSRATLANRLRLLKLPKKIQEEQLEGNLSERQAVALLPIYDLSPALKKKAAEYTWSDPDTIVEKTINGKFSSDDTRDAVESMIDRVTRDLKEARFPTDHKFKALKVIVASACDDCKLRVRRGQTMHCPDDDCWYKKGELWGKVVLKNAKDEMGIAILTKAEEEEYFDREDFYSYDREKNAAGKIILSEGCDKGNLRLRYVTHSSGSLKLGRAFRGVSVVCYHGRKKQCACLQRHLPAARAAQKGISLEEETDQAAAQKERERIVEEKIRAPATEAIAALFDEGSEDVWRMLADIVGDKVGTGIQNVAELKDLAAVQDYIAGMMIEYAMPWNPEHDLVETATQVCEYLQQGAKLAVDGLSPADFAEPEEEGRDGE